MNELELKGKRAKKASYFLSNLSSLLNISNIIITPFLNYNKSFSLLQTLHLLFHLCMF